MILYHFTHPNHFQSIMRQGLVPSDWRLRDQSIDRACVWLFDTPEPRPYMDERYVALTVCVEGDQVVNYAEYRHAHPGLMPWAGTLDIDHMWVAFDVIPPQRIRLPPRG